MLLIERKIRERSLKDHGKRHDREQLPFELLRESAMSGKSRRGIDQFSQRRAERDSTSLSRRQTMLHEEDQTRMGRFMGKVKGYASKSKDVISAKYLSSKVAFGRGKEEDVVELLASGSSSSGSGPTSVSTRPNGAGMSRGGGGLGPREPPKDIFDDI